MDPQEHSKDIYSMFEDGCAIAEEQNRELGSVVPLREIVDGLSRLARETKY
jgi:hypothetical protein